MALGSNRPGRAQGINELALQMAAEVSRVTVMANLADCRYGTLQQVPAPICHADVLPPFPYPQHLLLPAPGATGVYATAAPLEDS